MFVSVCVSEATAQSVKTHYMHTQTQAQLSEWVNEKPKKPNTFSQEQKMKMKKEEKTH